MRIRVGVCDDQALVRDGLHVQLGLAPDLAVVGTAADGEQAVQLALRERPDVLLMDIRMPVLDGIAATRRLTDEPGSPRVVILTTFDLDDYVFQALRAGASGFLLKDASAEELADAVRTVARGEAMLSPGVTRRVIEAFARTPEPVDAGAADDLSPRERQVLTLLAAGASNGEIARELVVSDATAKTHVSNVLAKLRLRDRVQAVIYAYEAGIVRPGGVDASRLGR